MQLPSHRPLAIAHRAGNDLAAMRAAEQVGADVIEVDVWLHRGRLEVRHTKSLGPLPFFWDRWMLEPAWKRQLRLEQVLGAVGAGVGIMFDLKGRNPDLPHALLDTIAPHIGKRPLMICGQNWGLLRHFAGVDGVLVVHSIGKARQFDGIWPLLDAVENDAVSIQYRLLTDSIVAELRKRVSLIITWPINDTDRLARVRAWQIDAITTDSLEIVRSISPTSETANPATP